jgi:NAD(P)-dependent dehydrogenase (short-subunit alcohol dehydrogenase family)
VIGASGTRSAHSGSVDPRELFKSSCLAPIQMLQGKVAVVTGSSSGIGAAIARELASRGASVVINYPYVSLEQQGESILEILDTPGISVQADLSTVEGPKQLIDTTVKKYGRIDILINNASVAIFKPLELAILDEWDRVVKLNGRGYLLTTQSALPHLSNPSRIINITSSDCRFPFRLTQSTPEQKGRSKR